MKKVLMLLAMLSISTPVFANDCARMINSIDGLSNKAKQELVVNCEQTKLDTTFTTPATTKSTDKAEVVVENMDKYSDIALKFAKALGIAAKELGVAVNEFVGTTAGMLTVGFIAYQLFGGLLSFTLISGLGIVFVNRLMARLRAHLVYESESEVNTTNIFGQVKSKTVINKCSWRQMVDSACCWYVLSFLIEAILIIVIIVNIPI